MNAWDSIFEQKYVKQLLIFISMKDLIEYSIYLLWNFYEYFSNSFKTMCKIIDTLLR